MSQSQSQTQQPILNIHLKPEHEGAAKGDPNTKDMHDMPPNPKEDPKQVSENPFLKLAEKQYDQFVEFFHQHWDPDQLLRVHVISARFHESKTIKANDTGASFCVVNVGTQKAETLKIKSSNLGEIKWDEHFSVEYFDKKEKDSFFQLEVYTDGTLKGYYKQKISDIVGEKDSWEKSKSKEVPLVDNSGNEVGFITFRIRREEKCYGNLNIHIKECELNNYVDQISSAKAVVNFSTTSHGTGISEAKNDGSVKRFNFLKSDRIDLEVNKNNNIFDIFFEVWDCKPIAIVKSDHNDEKHEEKQERTDKKPISGHIIGIARLPVYDTKLESTFLLPLLSQSPDHKLIGTIRVKATLSENKGEKAVQKTKKKKNMEDLQDPKNAHSDAKETDVKKDDLKTKEKVVDVKDK